MAESEAAGVATGVAGGAAAGFTVGGPWGALAGAVIGGAASFFGGRGQSKASEKAQKREREAAQRALEIQKQRFEEGRAALQPYAQQEQAASLQLMAQMGLAPPPGTREGGGAFGFGAPAMGQAPQEQADQRFMEDLIAQQMAINARSGIGLDSENIARASNQVRDYIRQMKASGRLPADFREPSQSEWSQLAYAQRDAYGGMKSLRRTVGDVNQTSGTPDLVTLSERRGGGDVQTQQMGPGQMIAGPGDRPIVGYDAGGNPVYGLEGAPVTGAEAEAGGGMPAPQTAQDIMRRAGVEGLPPEIQQQYLRELAEDPRTDPGLAAYLGLTPESLQVGPGYQETPAYAAARAAGVEAVEAGAAGAGTLYSGRRGKALRDVGQQVEQAYYFDAMGRRQQMMGARRGQRAEDIGRRGREYGAERGREQSYYNNYMTLLNTLAAPTTTTNIAAMGTNIGRTEAANLLGTARNIGELQMGQAAGEAAMYGDLATGAGNVIETFINREQQPVMGGPATTRDDPGLAAIAPTERSYV